MKSDSKFAIGRITAYDKGRTRTLDIRSDSDIADIHFVRKLFGYRLLIGMYGLRCSGFRQICKTSENISETGSHGGSFETEALDETDASLLLARGNLNDIGP